MADVTDGLSNTIMIGERTMMDSSDKMTCIYRNQPNPPFIAYPTQAQIDLWGQTADAAYPANLWAGCCGSTSWFFGHCYINEAAPPNWKYPDCASNGDCGASDWNRGFGARPPRSRHPGGVNVALGDASVRFVSETIDLTTWQYMGSRNDGKAFAMP
jgi:prepilin-type processing-associated H-X9-DG protein